MIYSLAKDFFDRNLFERLIIYIFLAGFLTKFIFELALGSPLGDFARNMQWFFYALLALDYLICLPKIIRIKITVNPISIFALILLMMVLHGLVVGILNHNKPFVILNDTIPILMIALNILRMQSLTEIKRKIDFKRILNVSTILIFAACIISLMANKAYFISAPVYLPLFFTALYLYRPFPKLVALGFLIVIALTINDTNRTNIFFIFVMCSVFLAIKTVRTPVQGLIIVALGIASLFTVWQFIPKDSKTYARITKIQNIDFNERKGSIGERAAEQDAVNAELANKGPYQEMLGLGFGGVYSVSRTHTYLQDYGHAHFAWVWFKLRFGNVGYFYFAIFLGAIIYNGTRSLQQRDLVGIMVFMMCFIALLYCMTYVNAIFLSSGAQFLYRHKEFLDKEEEA